MGKGQANMLTRIKCLSEVASTVPNRPRRFNEEEGPEGVDLDKVVSAKVFDGVIVSQSDSNYYCSEHTHRLVELFMEGGFSTVTTLDDRLMKTIFMDDTKESE